MKNMTKQTANSGILKKNMPKTTRFLVIFTFLLTLVHLSRTEPSQRGSRSILQQDQPIQLTTYESSSTQLKAPTSIPQFAKSNTRTSSSKFELTNLDYSATSASSSPNSTTATTVKATTSTNVDNTWIESILINVQSLNLNHDKMNGAKQASGDLDINSDEDVNSPLRGLVAGSSQAPTDSGEDPLEVTTISSSSSNYATNVTQYSIERSLTESSRTNSTSTSDDESNNVSSAAKDAQAKNDNNQIVANDRDGLISTSKSVTQAPKQAINCEQAYTQCALRKVCAPALKAYNDDCQDLIKNRTNQCSQKCLKAMIALRSSEEGDDLVNCDCQSNEYCTQSKQRSQACRPQVEEAVDPKTVVSCSTASWICMADQLCSTALEYFNRNCQILFSQGHCSMRCNNSLSILYRQPKASKLINCHCDGSEEFPCARYKTYTERFCLNKQPSQPIDVTGDEQHGEEDTFNLTNDPETFVLGSLSSYANNDDNNFNDAGEDDFDDSKVAAQDGSAGTGGAEESQSSGYNGIQVVEDNWIPLISGRYFTNLQEQRQKSQRRQKQVQQQQQLQDSSQQQLRKAGPPKMRVYHNQRYMEWIRNRRRANSSSSRLFLEHWKSGWHFPLVTLWSIVVYLSPRLGFTRLLLH